MRWFVGIMDLMDMGLNKLREIVKDRKAWHVEVRTGHKESDMTKWLNSNKSNYGFIPWIFKLLWLVSNTYLLLKIGTITIIIFLPIRYNFVYSGSIKNPCFRIWQTFGKHFLHSAGCGSISPTQSCWDAWISGSWLVRD